MNKALWTALVTPFTEDNKVDYYSLEMLLLRQEEAQNGVLLLGSTGEALSLSMKEKKEILDKALSLKLSIPIMVGVGGINIEEVLSWLGYLETIPIDSYLMVSPLYSKPGPIGQYKWFEKLLDSVSRPCMLYNIPGRTGSKLYQDVLNDLDGHRNFWAVKEASGSIDEFQKYRQALPHTALYSGDDALLPYFSLVHAEGLVSVASNVWPKETKKYVELCLEGNYRSLWPTWKFASDSLFTTSNPVPVKGLLNHLGLISTAHTRPPLSNKDLKEMEVLKEAHQLISKWGSI